MKTRLITAVLCCLVFSVTQADLFTDDFNRDDKTFVTGMGVTFGAGWIGGNIYAQANLADGEVDVTAIHPTAVQAFAMLRNDIFTENTGENSFKMSGAARIDSTSNGAWVGLIFNWVDGNNFYIFRYNAIGNVQMVTVVGNSIVAAPVNVSGAFTHVQGRKYELSVSSSDPYSFSLSLKDTVTDSVVWSGSGTDSGSRFSDGKGGLWSNNINSYLDDFSLETIPEPTTVGLLGFSPIAALLMRRLRGTRPV